MTRTERIRAGLDQIGRIMNGGRKWVTVHIEPGHTTTAPFVTLDPREAFDIAHTLDEIRRELAGGRTTLGT